MPKRITYLEKKDGLTFDDFRHHWAGTHGDIAKRLPGLTRYLQNHRLMTLSVPADDSPYRIDGIVELWFDTGDDARTGLMSPVSAELVIDEPRFLRSLTGAPTVEDHLSGDCPFKVWVLGRWGGSGATTGIEGWAERMASNLPGLLEYEVNVRDREAALLTRQKLQTESGIPDVAVAFGFNTDTNATEASKEVISNLDGLRPDLFRLQTLLAKEIRIV